MISFPNNSEALKELADYYLEQGNYEIYYDILSGGPLSLMDLNSSYYLCRNNGDGYGCGYSYGFHDGDGIGFGLRFGTFSGDGYKDFTLRCGDNSNGSNGYGSALFPL